MERSSYSIFHRAFLVFFFLFFFGHLSSDSIVTAEITDIATGIPTLFELTQEGFEEDEVVRIKGLEFQVNGTTLGGVSSKNYGEGETDQDKVIAFLGIRFSDSTAGAKRWTPSILHPLSPSSSPSSSSNITTHVLDATFFGAACPQTPSPFLRSQPQEDCLFLNIWAPKTALKKSPASSFSSLLPVLVFIHGGAFYMGSANDPYIDGGQLVKSGSEEILLVSINYRLGVLGFLAHPSLTETQPTAPTNFGLLDQRIALIWIQNHIRLFGGDPNRVTIAGESAGAMSVLFHLVALPSPQVGERK
jgi:carboxylesterase type B